MFPGKHDQVLSDPVYQFHFAPNMTNYWLTLYINFTSLQTWPITDWPCISISLRSKHDQILTDHVYQFHFAPNMTKYWLTFYINFTSLQTWSSTDWPCTSISLCSKHDQLLTDPVYQFHTFLIPLTHSHLLTSFKPLAIRVWSNPNTHQQSIVTLQAVHYWSSPFLQSVLCPPCT
jgi:hypothetical protein